MNSYVNLIVLIQADPTATPTNGLRKAGDASHQACSPKKKKEHANKKDSW